MERLKSFASDNHLTAIENAFVGNYADMFVALEEKEGAIELHVCMDLPRGGKREKLLAALREKQEKYQAQVEVCANEKVIRFSFADGEDALARMERYMSECDVLLRPYTREMGVLCGKCRNEIHSEDAFEVENVDGEWMPVCAACAQGVTSRGENRRLANRKRVRKGILGALVGLLVSAAFFALLASLSLDSLFLPSIVIGFLLNFFYRRFGGIEDKWCVYLLASCAVVAIILGGFVASSIVAARLNSEMKNYADLAMSDEEILKMTLENMQVNEMSVHTWLYSRVPNMIAAVIGVVVFHKR